MAAQSKKWSELNDYELLYMIRQQDEMAFQYLFKKYEYYLKALIAENWKCSFSLFDESDLLQLSYLKVLDAVDCYRENKDCSFLTYMTLCVVRYLAGLRRMEIRHKPPFSLQNEIREASRVVYEDRLENNQRLYEPSYYIEFKSLLEKTKEFMNSLNEKDKKVWECLTAGLSYKEAAKRLEITTKAYDNAVYRIKKKFNRYLK